MAAVPAQLLDEFGHGPIDDSVLRFIKTHRACAVWEGKVKIKTDHLLNILFLSFYIMLIFFLPISEILSVNGITSFQCMVMRISWVKLDWLIVSVGVHEQSNPRFIRVIFVWSNVTCDNFIVAWQEVVQVVVVAVIFIVIIENASLCL